MSMMVNPYRFGATPPPAAIPTFSNVSLLIHGNARPFMDSSNNAFPVANWGGRATLASGAIFTSATTNHTQALVLPANTAFVFGTGSWAITCKIKCDTGGARIWDTRASGTGIAINIQASTLAPFFTVNSTNYGLGTPAINLVLTANVEADVAFCYDGTVLRCFVNGLVSWAQTVSLNLTSNNKVFIGNDEFLVDGVANQYIRELMVIKGEATYVAAYTPDTTHPDTGTVIAAAPEPATYSNVKLNIHGSSLANNSTAITDTSTAARTVTVNGNLKATTAQFRIGTSSLDFDGVGDYATVPSSVDFAFGTGDYLVEGQFRQTANTRGIMYSTYVDSTHGWTMQHSVSTAGLTTFNEVGDGSQLSTIDGLLTLNTWKHVAAGRFSALAVMFIEGELVHFAPSDTNSISNSVALYIGRLTTISTSVDFKGQAQELRVIKGEMPYKHSFIVHTAAHPDS